MKHNKNNKVYQIHTHVYSAKLSTKLRFTEFTQAARLPICAEHALTRIIRVVRRVKRAFTHARRVERAFTRVRRV